MELDRLGRAYGVRAFAAHPGLVPSSNLGSGSMGEHASGLAKGMMKILPRIIRLFHVSNILNLFKQLKPHHVGDEFKTNQQGAATPVWCAISEELAGKGGVYCKDCNIAVAVQDSTSPYGALPWAIDPVQATRLWPLSEELTVLHYQLRGRTAPCRQIHIR
ncbi:hypothetical protein [Paenibacillus graminis]|uniref:hypothetical protein n=1 Tax=Paenibacillus graminis TaxID=189425 RepID=UPI000FB487FF|nr:hypothetical protein [Paenibacillus graminis]MEC0170532.1 hypothetical protein [Paenibacillus graminis]